MSMEDKKHKIQRGYWIIRDPQDPPPSAQFEMSPFGGIPRDVNDYHAFSDHATYVLDATQTHLAIFDPIIGRPGIIVYDRFPGDWRYATEEQVKVTWIMAKLARRDHAMQIEMEMKEFKYRSMKEAGGCAQ